MFSIEGDSGHATSSRGGLSIWTSRDEPAEMSSQYKEIVVHPRDPDTVYVGDSAWVSAGVSRTIDGGKSWTKVTTSSGVKKNMDYGWITEWGPSVECMAISPAKPDRLVFGTSGHVFSTDDACKSWQQRYCQVQKDRFQGTGLEVTCFWCMTTIGRLIRELRGISDR